jgi:hypothetical protein
MKTKLWKKAWVLMLALFLSWGFFPGPVDAAAPKTFTDKVGYFSFTPPPGWVEKDYPDAAMGRVRFTSPDRQASLSIIVLPAPAPETTFEKLLAEKQGIMERMRREKPDGKYRLGEGTICKFRCVKFVVEFPGQIIQENYLFVEKGLSVSFGYAAANQESLEKYRQTAQNSFCTIKLKKK